MERCGGGSVEIIMPEGVGISVEGIRTEVTVATFALEFRVTKILQSRAFCSKIRKLLKIQFFIFYFLQAYTRK